MAYTRVAPPGMPELEELADEELLDELLDELLEEELVLDEEELDELLEDELLLVELLLEVFPPPSPPHPTNRAPQASVPAKRLSNLLILYILLFNPALVIIEPLTAIAVR
jgi:hypothetical protein